MFIDRAAASYLHGTKLSERSTYIRNAAWNIDFKSMNEKGWIPKNQYEKRRIETKTTSRQPKKHAYQYFYKVDFYKPEDYFDTLNLLTSPQEYIKMLCLYRSFGIELSVGLNHKYIKDFEWELILQSDTDIKSQVKKAFIYHTIDIPTAYHSYRILDTYGLEYDPFDAENFQYVVSTNKPETYNLYGKIKNGAAYCFIPVIENYPGYDKRYSFHYIISLYRFKEIIDSYYLKEVYALLNTAQLEDLPTVESYYSNLVNRTTKDIDRLIDSEVLTIIRFDNINSEENFKCAIPERIDIYEFRNLIPYNLQYLIETTESGIEFVNPRKILREIWKQALSLVAQNIEKLAGRLAQLQDPKSVLTRTDFQEDPYRNPFLVYNKELSNETGETTFENVATNQSYSMKDLEKYYTSQLTPPKYLDMAAEIQETYERKTSLDNINKLSLREISEIAGIGPDKEKKSILPALFLAGGAAFTLWQITQ